MKVVCLLNFLLFFSIPLFALEQQKPISSIQGKAYPDHINGVYDRSITDAEVEKFLNGLKEAVKECKVEKISEFFSYPFRLNTTLKTKNGTKNVTTLVKTKKQFKKNYRKIFTEKVKGAINNASLDNLFVKYTGFMIGNGEIWFDPRKGIIAVNAS